MKCFNSFSFRSQGDVLVPGGLQYDAWGVAPQNYWGFDSGGASSSTFNIQGFKNIDVYGIDAVGTVTSGVNTASVLVNDWDFLLTIGGNSPLISGNIAATNDFNISQQATNPVICLSKYTPKINFQDPVNSVKFIQINNLRAFGIGVENIAFLKLIWSITFTVYYSYEGEDLLF